MRASRREVISFLLERDFDGLQRLEREKGGVFRVLRGLGYDPEELIFWRACEAMGPFSRQKASEGPELVRGMVRRLIWSLSDESGDMAWNAPAMLTEMYLWNPDICQDIAPILVHLDELIFRKSAVLAAARISEDHPEVVREVIPELKIEMENVDPETRAYAAWALGNLRAPEAIGRLKELTRDQAGPVKVYRCGELLRFRVCDLASEALDRVEAGE